MIKRLLTDVSYLRVRIFVSGVSSVFGIALAAILYKIGFSFQTMEPTSGFNLLSGILILVMVIISNLFLTIMESIDEGFE